MDKLKVYEYNQIKNLVSELLKLYRTNDIRSHKNHKDLLLNDIELMLEVKNIDSTDFIKSLDDASLSKKKSEFLLQKLKIHVEEFELPSSAVISKLFKKVKKLKVPDLDLIDRKEISFLSWNDLSGNRKYFIYKNALDEYQGAYGEISSTKVKGFCKICNQESDVSLFLNKSKTSSDGTYKKKGDYICHDSMRCNSNLTDINDLYHFIDNLN